MDKQRPKLIDMIADGAIESAIRKEGCFIWASLPENNDFSHYELNGKKQPATPLQVCIEHYNAFFEQESKGISNLHLKKGFLNEFGHECCSKNETSPVNFGNCNLCGEKHYDLTNKVKWQSQFDAIWGDKKAQSFACKKACDAILNKNGLSSTSKLAEDLYQTAIENKDHSKLLINNSVSQTALKYINDQLLNGHPVQVGVDHALDYKGGTLNEGTTDHFIVIVGKNCEKGNVYYRFYDVGTSYESKGASTNNRLHLNKANYALQGRTEYNKNSYTVTQVRKNKNK